MDLGVLDDVGVGCKAQEVRFLPDFVAQPFLEDAVGIASVASSGHSASHSMPQLLPHLPLVVLDQQQQQQAFTSSQECEALLALLCACNHACSLEASASPGFSHDPSSGRNADQLPLARHSAISKWWMQ